MIALSSSNGVIDTDSTKLAEYVEITSDSVNHLQSDNTEGIAPQNYNTSESMEVDSTEVDPMEVVESSSFVEEEIDSTDAQYV